MNTVKRVVPALIASGLYSDPWLGITGLSVTPLLAETLELPVDRGVMLGNIVTDGPAAKAGLPGSERRTESEAGSLSTGGDIIVSLDGQSIRDMDDLITFLAERMVGQVVTLGIMRAGEEQAVEVTLEARPVP